MDLNKYINILNEVAAPRIKQENNFSHVYFDLQDDKTIRATIAVKKEDSKLVMVAEEEVFKTVWKKEIVENPSKFLAGVVQRLVNKVNTYGKY